MPTITDWLMVAITLVYVVATIAIWYANNKSVKEARNQIVESQRQFEETQRLQVMPSFQFSVYRAGSDLVLPAASLLLASDENGANGFCPFSKIELSIRNVGFGPAKDIFYHWFDTINTFDRGLFPIHSLCSQEDDSVRIDIAISESVYKKNPCNQYNPSIILHYKDLLGNDYMQEIHLTFCTFDEDECLNTSALQFKSFSVGSATFLPTAKEPLQE